MASRLGDHIREERLRRQLTLQQLANLVGVSFSAISQIELGKTYPGTPLLFALGKYLDLSPFLPPVSGPPQAPQAPLATCRTCRRPLSAHEIDALRARSQQLKAQATVLIIRAIQLTTRLRGVARMSAAILTLAGCSVDLPWTLGQQDF